MAQFLYNLLAQIAQIAQIVRDYFNGYAVQVSVEEFLSLVRAVDGLFFVSFVFLCFTMPSNNIVSKAKRTRLSLKNKIEIIEKSPSTSIADLMKKHNATASTIYHILSRKSELKNEWLHSRNPDMKNKIRTTEHDEINDAVLTWFRGATAKGLPVSGPLLQEKALEFARLRNDGAFKASNGWLDAFRKRNSIVFNVVCGEARDVNAATVNDWLSKLPTIIAGYEARNIANADETALFFVRYLIKRYHSRAINVLVEKCRKRG